jgi:hypothetical protein
MKRGKFLTCLLLTLPTLVWAHGRETVAEVRAVSGAAQASADHGHTFHAIHKLERLAAGDLLRVPARASLTVHLLDNSHYESVTGPCEVAVEVGSLMRFKGAGTVAAGSSLQRTHSRLGRSGRTGGVALAGVGDPATSRPSAPLKRSHDSNAVTPAPLSPSPAPPGQASGSGEAQPMDAAGALATMREMEGRGHYREAAKFGWLHRNVAMSDPSFLGHLYWLYRHKLHDVVRAHELKAAASRQGMHFDELGPR